MYKVLTAVNMKITLFWNVIPCSLVERYQCFGRTCCFHLQIRRVNHMGKQRYMERRKGNRAHFLPYFPSSFTLHCVTSQTTVIFTQKLVSYYMNEVNTPFEIRGEVLRKKVKQVSFHEDVGG
jgi:hypothetical protein